MKYDKDSFYHQSLIKDYVKRYGPTGRDRAMREIGRIGTHFTLDMPTFRQVRKYRTPTTINPWESREKSKVKVKTAKEWRLGETTAE